MVPTTTTPFLFSTNTDSPQTSVRIRRTFALLAERELDQPVPKAEPGKETINPLQFHVDLLCRIYQTQDKACDHQTKPGDEVLEKNDVLGRGVGLEEE